MEGKYELQLEAKHHDGTEFYKLTARPDDSPAVVRTKLALQQALAAMEDKERRLRKQKQDDEREAEGPTTPVDTYKHAQRLARGLPPTPPKAPKRKAKDRRRRRTEVFKPPLPENAPCCKRLQCSNFFSERAVKNYREMAESFGPDPTRRARQAMAIHPTITLPCGSKCCTAYLRWLFGLNRNNMYYRRKGYQRRKDKNSKECSVMAWFTNFKLVLDHMPDEDAYQVNAPFKNVVYDWYMEYVREFPEIFQKTDPTYFKKIWRTEFPKLKLRKWLRFSQCLTCAELRKKRWSRHSKISREEKEAAMEQLVALPAHQTRAGVRPVQGGYGNRATP